MDARGLHARLNLIEQKSIDIAPLITHRYTSFADVEKALSSDIHTGDYVKGVVILATDFADERNKPIRENRVIAANTSYEGFTFRHVYRRSSVDQHWREQCRGVEACGM
jgi:hypothetical protein